MLNPNFLILDEPSNDLDIDTLNVLEDFLMNYNGVLILVSHDRYLLDKLTEQLFIFEGEGKIDIYNGNYADYKTEQDILLKEQKQKKDIPVQKKEEVKEEKKKLSYKEQLEYDKLEKEIQQLEELLVEKNDTLHSTVDHVQLSSIAKEIEDIQNSIDVKSERWLSLAELM